jgi:signal transduction histidine kinase/ActR/RegA family two-component response regulator
LGGERGWYAVGIMQHVPQTQTGHSISGFLRAGQANLRLRTKLLLSFAVLTAGLTCATLLVVRQNAQDQAQQHIEQDTKHATLTFQAVQRQQQMALSRKADLLSSLAAMRNGDVTAIEDAGNDPWQSEDCNLFVLADKNTKIEAQHTTGPALTDAAVQKMLWHSLARGETSGWWSNGTNLYQVVLQPFYEDAAKQSLEGIVVVGRLVDSQAAHDLGKMASTDVVFRYGDELSVGTLTPVRQKALEKRIPENSGGARVSLDGENFYANTVSLTPGMYPATNLIVLKSYREVEAYLNRLNDVLLVLGLVTVLAGGTLIFIISDTITRPIAALMRGVQALERDDFSYPLAKAAGQDEVSKLTRAFAGMRGTLQSNQTQREQLESQLRQAQKMEALGRLAGGVAHDFNNLLTVIRGHSELLLDRLPAGNPLHNNSQQILKTADRAATLTRQMLAFSRMQVVQARVLDINELVPDMGKLLRRLIREDIELSFRLGDSLGRVKADAGQLEQVLLNLTVNASDAMPLGGKLVIETLNVVVDSNATRVRPSVEPGDYVMLSVTDTGCGMDAETKARIFEPFFTTKEPGKGTGLGLATVYGVVKQSGGFLWVESEPGRGTRFELYFPRTVEQVETTFMEAQSRIKASVCERKTVLVVEDEKEVRGLACEFLTAAGYRVVTAQDGLEALEIVARLGSGVHAVLTDVVMPNMRGPELGNRLRKMQPQVKIVYMTGYLENKGGDHAIQEDALFLQKPFSRETVVQQVACALRGGLTEKQEAQISSSLV